MKVEKLIKAKMEREYFFIKGRCPIDAKYFIKQIEVGIKQADNKSYTTNVIGEMTDYKYFLNDKKFMKFFMPVLDLLDTQKFQDFSSYRLQEAWGFKEGFTNYTKQHQHLPAVLSGAVQLSNHEQMLEFPQIDETLESKPGNFAIFSSFLLHKNKRSVVDKPRYGLSFNIYNDFNKVFNKDTQGA